MTTMTRLTCPIEEPLKPDHLRRITRTNLGSALLVACLMEVRAGAQTSSGAR